VCKVSAARDPTIPWPTMPINGEGCCDMGLSLRGDLAPPTLLWGHHAFGAAAQNACHHASDGNSEEDLANEFHAGLLLWERRQAEWRWR
jgi:hypothetical protein